MNYHPKGKHASACETCEPRHPVRNHYFTGKLLVERDFTDEQAYLRQKLRIHHQRLHGAGIVCGLDLVQHPNPACRDRLMILEPGSAVDCCGQDILVLEPEVIALADFPAIQALIDKPDGKAHTLRFCLQYRECPIEEVPVLFDDCGCDDTACAPNRILESFALEVEIDPPEMTKPRLGASLVWTTTALIAHARHVAYDEAKRRLFVANADDPATLYELDAETLALNRATGLGAKAQALAAAPDGSAVYAIVGSGPDDRKLLTFTPDGPNGIADPPRSVTLADTGGGDASLAVASDGRVATLGHAKGAVALFAAGVPAPGTPLETRLANAARTGLAFASDGLSLLTATPGGANLHRIVIGMPASDATTTIAGTVIDGLDVVRTPGPEKIVAIDRAGKKLRLLDPAAATIAAELALASAPLAVSLAGSAHALVTLDAGEIQAVDIAAFDLGAPDAAGVPVKIGADPGLAVATPDGARVFAPYAGDPAVASSGGLAVLDLVGLDCAASLLGGECPQCTTNDCLVVAEVRNWRLGFALNDMPQRKPTLTDDEAAKIARIDNSVRTILPRVQDVAKALLCLLKSPVGRRGPDGKQGPEGDKGPRGDPFTQDLTRICGINWEHGGQMALTPAAGAAFVPVDLRILFNKPVELVSVNNAVFRVMLEHNEPLLVGGERTGFDLRCWCDVIGEITAHRAKTPCDPETKLGRALGARMEGDVVRFIGSIPVAAIRRGAFLRIELQCDLIVDTDKRLSVDGNHLAPWLPKRPTGDEIPGGLFVSWLRLEIS